MKLKEKKEKERLKKKKEKKSPLLKRISPVIHSLEV